MKNSIVILLILNFCFCLSDAESKDIKVTFTLNGKETSSARFYILNHQHATILPYIDGKLTLPDSINSSFKILLLYNNYHVILTAPKPNDIYYLRLYYDDRIFNNLANFQMRAKKLTLRYLFKKRYVVLFGDGAITETTESKQSKNYFNSISFN